MLHTLEHIRTKYGSLEHYLSSISFPLAAQQKLVHILLAPESERKKKHARRVSRGILPVVGRDTINVGVPGNVKVKEGWFQIVDFRLFLSDTAFLPKSSRKSLIRTRTDLNSMLCSYCRSFCTLLMPIDAFLGRTWSVVLFSPHRPSAI